MKTLTVTAPELRFAEDSPDTFQGYAAIFDVPNSYNETIQRGAFKKSLKERAASGGIPMLWSHDPSEPIGTFTSLREDDHGLHVTGHLVTETTRGREALALLKAKAVSGLSIGFHSRGDKRGPNGVRILTDIELMEISIVTLPAADGARITKVRSLTRDRIATFTNAAISAAESIRSEINLDEFTKDQAGH